ncbi:MAG: hypothetical protein ACRDXE_06960, partial [Acidimicrobiales bacterium]
MAAPVPAVDAPRRSTRRLALTWLLLAAVPVAAILSATAALAAMQSHERQARADRLFVQHIHEDALLQHILVSHALVMGYLTPDLTSEFYQLQADANTHLHQSGALGGTHQAQLIGAVWQPFEGIQLRALGGLRAASGSMSAPMSGPMTPAPGMAPSAGMAGPMGMAGSAASLGPTFDAVMTAVSRADQAFATEVSAAGRDSLLGSVGAVGA